MSTYSLYLGRENIDRATSGSHYLLFEGGGHTGSLNLIGDGYFNYINASGLAVQNNLRVTGGSVNFGPHTGYGVNHLARIVSTGDSYLKKVTGTLTVDGNIDLNGPIRTTGDLHVTGAIYINGQDVLSLANSTGFLTGDFASSFTGKGDILVGTGVGLYSVISTGGATSGNSLIFDPSSPTSYRLGEPVLANVLTRFTEASTKVGGATSTSFFVSTGSNTNIGFAFNGSGNIIIGGSGTTNTFPSNNCFFYGENHGGSINSKYCSLFGSNGLMNSNITGAVGIGNLAELHRNNEFCQGGGSYQSSIPGQGTSSSYIFLGRTTNSSTTVIGTVPLESSQVVTISCLISAIEEDGSDGFGLNAAGYEVKACYKNDAGVVTLIGSQSKTVLGEENAAFDANLNHSGGDVIDISVNGDVSLPVRWAARVETSFISF